MRGLCWAVLCSILVSLPAALGPRCSRKSSEDPRCGAPGSWVVRSAERGGEELSAWLNAALRWADCEALLRLMLSQNEQKKAAGTKAVHAKRCELGRGPAPGQEDHEVDVPEQGSGTIVQGATMQCIRRPVWRMCSQSFLQRRTAVHSGCCAGHGEKL